MIPRARDGDGLPATSTRIRTALRAGGRPGHSPLPEEPGDACDDGGGPQLVQPAVTWSGWSRCASAGRGTFTIPAFCRRY